MTKIASFRSANGTNEIYQVEESHGPDFYVYQADRLIRVCPSIGMAHEIAGGL